MAKECLLCLELNKEYVHFMNFYAQEWSDHNIKNLIEKHLWPVTSLKSQSEWICTACWKMLHEFHQFYRRIEDIQAYFDDVGKSECIEIEDYKLTEFEKVAESISSSDSECDLYSQLGKPEDYPEFKTPEKSSEATEDYPEFKTPEKYNHKNTPEKSSEATESILNEKTSDIISGNFITELYTCQFCGKLFKSQDLLSKHTVWHKGEVCSCEICDLKFFDIEKLIQHKKIHIPKEILQNTTNRSDEPTIHQETSDGFVNYSCGEFDYMETEIEMEQDTSILPSTSNNCRLECTHCFKIFVSQKTMANHVAWHKGEIYQCNICDLKFFDVQKYEVHKMSHEEKKTSNITSNINDSGPVESSNYISERRSFTCKFCSNIYANEKVYLNHIAWHEDNIFHCTICDLKFFNAYKFIKHKSEHEHDFVSNQTLDANSGALHQNVEHINQKDIGIQSSTGFKKIKLSVLQAPQPEIADDHPPQRISISDSVSPLVVEKSGDAIDILENDANNYISEIIEVECTLCCKVLENERVLSKHLAWHDNTIFQCHICQMKYFDSSTFEQHLASHADEPPEVDDVSNIEQEYFICSVCSKVLGSRRLFLNHKAWHLNTIHLCEICDLKFLDKTKYEDHKDTHLPKSWKRCRDCGKAFAGPSDVKRHWQKMHRNKFVKICDVCGVMYRCPLAFKRHTDQHKGYTAPKRPCDICGRLLKGINSLRSHKFIHHPKNGILPYNCHICFKGLGTRSLLNRHIAIRHAPSDIKHKCTICDKEFKSRACLRDHADTHNTEAKYQCQWCTKAFTRSTYLSRHRKKVHPKEYEEWKSELFVKV